MRNKLYFFLLLSAIYSCKKDHQPSLPEKKTVIKEATELLLFKVIPLADNQVKVSFRYIDGRKLVKLLLKKDTTTLGTFTVQDDLFNFYSTVVNYQFNSNDKYNFVIQSNAVNDTIYQYAITGYNHVYKSAYNYQKLLQLTQGIGGNAYDISPSHNSIFILDYKNMKLVLKKLTLSSMTIDSFPDVNTGLTVRAMSDDELLLETGYPNQLPGGDTLMLVKYNVKTKQSEFIDWISSSYGRTSRIVNNNVLVTSPFPWCFVSMVNLTDKSKVRFSQGYMDFRFVREHNFDNLYYQNSIMDIKAKNLVPQSYIASDEALEYIDSATQYSLATKTTVIDVNHPSGSRLSVYHQANKIFESEFLPGRHLMIGRLLNIKNNRILFYQYYDYDTTFKIDGYYVLDLNTKQISLVQCDYQPYLMYDFQLDDRTIVSVRPQAIYKLTLQ